LPFRIAYKIAYKTPTRHQLQWDMNYGGITEAKGLPPGPLSTLTTVFDYVRSYQYTCLVTDHSHQKLH